MEETFVHIQENVARLRHEMSNYPDARLMAVVKTRQAEEINFAVRECGVTLLGENRVQELLSHYDALDRGASVHFIGTLQKNKVKYIIDKVDMIESLDSLPLAAEIDKRAAGIGRKMPVLIEVNIGREPAKGGILPEELPTFCEALHDFENLLPGGLMTIAPNCGDDAAYEGYFSELARLGKEIFTKSFPSAGLILSMGMSGSYPAALRCGSNIIRVGEGIFGKRRIFPKS